MFCRNAMKETYFTSDTGSGKKQMLTADGTKADKFKKISICVLFSSVYVYRHTSKYLNGCKS